MKPTNPIAGIPNSLKPESVNNAKEDPTINAEMTNAYDSLSVILDIP